MKREEEEDHVCMLQAFVVDMNLLSACLKRSTRLRKGERGEDRWPRSSSSCIHTSWGWSITPSWRICIEKRRRAEIFKVAPYFLPSDKKIMNSWSEFMAFVLLLHFWLKIMQKNLTYGQSNPSWNASVPSLPPLTPILHTNIHPSNLPLVLAFVLQVRKDQKSAFD